MAKLIDTGSKTYKKFSHIAYSAGAAVVILGALFKIRHLPGADIMLTVGLGTEAFIFLIAAIEKPAKDYDWALIYPELEADNFENAGSVVNQLDDALEKGGVDAALIERLGEGMRSLSETASSLSGAADAAGATAAYSDQLSTAATHMESLNALYSVQLENTTAQVERQNDVMEKLASASDNATDLASELASLKGNLESLNNVYGGMLTAMGK
jgi:gliding motility-associated protein GldL